MAALSRKNRLTDRKTIGLVMRCGRKLAANGLRAYFGGQAADSWRAAVVAPKKIDKRATVRNRLRRQIKEIIKQKMRSSGSAPDVVVYLEPGAAELSFAELKKELGALLDRATE